MENNTLEYLMLDNCNISYTGLEALFEALIHNKTLVELHLNGNPIGSEGVSLLCTLKLLQNYKYLLDMLFYRQHVQ